MNPGDDVQLIEGEVAAERVRMYGFLAGVCCSAPTAESAHAVSQLALALGISCPEGLSLGELEREFMDLFVVPNPRYVAPYESVYRDGWLLEPASVTEPGKGPAPLVMERLLMGESTMAVRQAYLQAGVLPEEDLPDHIGNELRFMAHLWAREAEAGEEGAGRLADLREAFRRDHLLQWIRPLLARVQENDRLGFYRVVLEIAAIVLESDSGYPDRGTDLPEEDSVSRGGPLDGSQHPSPAPAAGHSGSDVGTCLCAAARRRQS